MGKFPFISISIFFSIGIILQNLFNINQIYLSYSILFLLLIIIISWIIKRESSKTILYSTLVIILLLGALFSNPNNTNGARYPFQSPKIRNAEVEGKITTIDVLKEKKLSFEIELSSLDSIRILKNDHTSFICNIWKDTTQVVDSLYHELKIGNSLNFVGTVTRAKNQRNPGEFDYEKYLLENGISGVINCYKPESLRISSSKYLIIQNLVFNIRKVIDNKIKILHNDQTAALLKGVLLADRSDIDYNIKTSFVNSGVIHVLAVSGLHVGFIIVIFYLLFGRFDLRLKMILTAIGIIVFAIITGGHPSVFRASTMAIVFLIAKLTNRSTNGFNSIAIAGVIILLLNPADIFNPGFQLSFSAVISILILYPILSKIINQYNFSNLIKKLLLFMSVSLAAQIGTLPFTIIYFNKLSLISLFANLFVIPVIGFIVVIGIITVVISSISIFIASYFASANIFIVNILYKIIDYISELKYSFIPIYNFSIIDGIIFYGFLSIIIFAFIKFEKRILLFPVLFVLGLSLTNFISLDDDLLLKEGNLSVLTIDVGQGDSFLLKFPNGKTALIDAGNATEYFDNGKRVIEPLLNRFDIEKINYLFLSHLDSDHYAGAIHLINSGYVDTVFKPYEFQSIKDSVFENFLSTNKIPCNNYTEMNKIISGCSIYFLNDTSNSSYKNFDSNNKSGIIKVVYGETSFLFVGDAEFEAEELLVERYSTLLKSDVLKIGHHGSKTSSSDEFIDLVNPKIGIVSAGLMNKFKHPSKSVIDRFNKRNIKIYRTDFEGAILLTSDGTNIKYVNWRN